MMKYAMQILKHPPPSKRRTSRSQPPPTFVAEPVTQSNSFVGTEEYIAPVCSIFVCFYLFILMFVLELFSVHFVGCGI